MSRSDYHTYQINSQLAATFASKFPHTTFEVRISMMWPTCEQTLNLLDQAFTSKGWQRDPVEVPPSEGMRMVVYYKDGSGLFGGWTPAEECQNSRDARLILDTLNIGPVHRYMEPIHGQH